MSRTKIASIVVAGGLVVGIGSYVVIKKTSGYSLFEVAVPYAPVSGDTEPTWSPDGTRIAFKRIGEEDAGHIYVVESDGSNLRKLSHANLKNDSPVWSPDGSRIAFYNLDGLTVTDADGDNVRLLKDGVGPSWSSDGRSIAFMRGNSIELTRVTDGAVRRLVRRGDYPSWSTNGTSIAFTRPVAKHSRIFVARANGTGVRGLSNASDFTVTAWSPDGTSIAFTRHTPTGYRIFVIRANGTGVRKVTHASGWDNGYPLFAWSPDGRWIAFDRNQGIYLVRVAGGKERRLARVALDWVWSPDGRTIAFLTRGRLYTVGIDSVRPRRLAISKVVTPAGRRVWVDEFAWSPDGGMIVFSAYGRLYVVEAAGGRARGLTDGGF